MRINHFIEELNKLTDTSNFRTLKNYESNSCFILDKGRKMLNLSSNDYLGIGGNSAFSREFAADCKFDFCGSTSSRLLTGNHKIYTELENLLASVYQRQSALVFNSGYNANVGILPALTQKGDLILADKLVHASIIDGLKLSNAQVVRYRHNDYEHLEKLLQKHTDLNGNIFIVSESIFSMDGDLCELHKLIDIKKKYNAFLYLDEAHAVGIRGNKGLGIAEENDLIGDIDFIIGTFGKAYASQGAYIICDKLFADYLTNKMRSLIFTTALPPISIAWTKFVFEKTLDMQDSRLAVKKIADNFVCGIKAKGYNINSQSQIVPFMVYDNEKSILLAEDFQQKGFYVLPVRPPTVPDGTARLRFSLNATIKPEHINSILNILPDNKQ